MFLGSDRKDCSYPEHVFPSRPYPMSQAKQPTHTNIFKSSGHVGPAYSIFLWPQLSHNQSEKFISPSWEAKIIYICSTKSDPSQSSKVNPEGRLRRKRLVSIKF